MNEARDFQLLDDEESTFLELNSNFTSNAAMSGGNNKYSNSNSNYQQDEHITTSNGNKSHDYNSNRIMNTIKIQNKSNTTMTVRNNNNNNNTNNTNSNSLANPVSNYTTSTTATGLSRPNRFNISPNKLPDANDPASTHAKKYEFKAIERPRSRPHSPLNMKGIEEYAQQYASTTSLNNNNDNGANAKITMNLKMDDLLASVKNEATTYQMLDDFSVLTGDIEELVSGKANPKKKANTKRNSLTGDNFNNYGGDDKSDDDDANENDDEMDNDEDESKNKFEKGTSICEYIYKYLYIYRKRALCLFWSIM